MIDLRSQSKRKIGWIPSTLFNIFILLIPFVSASIVLSGYNGVPHLNPVTAEVLADTRKSIDRAFSTLPSEAEDMRHEWASLISQKLDERNMSAARGFLLAAPQMLSPSDSRAILVAAEADPEGSEDDRLLRAALLFVPSDIRVNYESSLRPRGLELVKLEEEESLGDPVELADASLATQVPGASTAQFASMTHTPAFSVLGTVEDLVSRSRDWMRGNRQRTFEMRLTGIAMASPPSATGLDKETLVQAASVLKTAWRSDRLQSQYARLFSQRLAAALPEETLTENLELALSDIATLDVRAQKVQDAFARSLDTHATERLGPELQQIALISEVTSPRGALTLLEHVETSTDVSRARLLAQAGGDRAVALTSLIGSDAFQVTGTGLKWNRQTVLWTMMLALSFMILLLSALAAIQNALFGDRVEAVL